MRKSACRLEFVVEQNTALSDNLHALDFFDLINLEQLLESVPLLAPLPPQTLSCIRHLGLWMCKELRELLEGFQKTGNVLTTWQSYQLELASEKLLWGKPLCSRSTTYSVNLGPGALGPSRSLTDQFGFLSLDVYSTCMQNDRSIPPPEIWTNSEMICKMIARSVGLHDHLDASYGVIGRHLVVALLHDLHETGRAASYVLFEDFLGEMKSDKTRFKTFGAVTLKSLIKLLTTKRRTETQMIFSSLCRLLEKNTLPVEDIVQAGFQELNLKHFPAVSTYDRHGNMILAWSFHGNFWNIVIDQESHEIQESTQQMMSDLVRGDLEKRGLVYPSKLKKTPKVLPWVFICLRRFQREKLELDPTVTILTYISCIAFLMQGFYVEYDRLAALIIDLPLDKNRLIALEILSKLQLAKFSFRNLQLHRLHFSVPHKVELETGEQRKNKREEETRDTETSSRGERMEEMSKKIGDDDDPLLFDKNIGHKRTSTCKPVTKIT